LQYTQNLSSSDISQMGEFCSGYFRFIFRNADECQKSGQCWIMGAKMRPLLTESSCELALPHIAWTDAPATAARSLDIEILTLFDSLRVPLLRYAISFDLSAADGEDIIQETFMALFHHLRRGRSRSNLRGWVFRVTHNLALKRRRLNRNQFSLISADNYQPEHYPASDPDPEQKTIFGERQAQLVAIYKALSENDRRCLQLRAEGLTYREIANVVGISLGSVSNSLVRSLSRMTLVERGDQCSTEMAT
jgi:RNA polymerase sigma-70 factor, ECF subfamily